MKGMVGVLGLGEVIVPDQLKGEPFVNEGTAPPNAFTMLVVIWTSSRAPKANFASLAAGTLNCVVGVVVNVPLGFWVRSSPIRVVSK